MKLLRTEVRCSLPTTCSTLTGWTFGKVPTEADLLVQSLGAFRSGYRRLLLVGEIALILMAGSKTLVFQKLRWRTSVRYCNLVRILI
jgi:hypothetical protein